MVHITLLKKSLSQVFSCEFSEISKNAFLAEHLATTACEVKFGDTPYLLSGYVSLHLLQYQKFC